MDEFKGKVLEQFWSSGVKELSIHVSSFKTILDTRHRTLTLMLWFGFPERHYRKKNKKGEKYEF